ncbi:barstar family protein [Streptomyces canus]|uniref:barstar family protein n=1 Tax=Streptomyces canus TaxID=58343 RepID=UPI002E30A5B0|nr:barstar family protein [Streptomyces canus]
MDYLAWEQEIPVRYVVKDNDDENILIRCAGAEGLFWDAELPIKEPLVLVGCVPRGPLSAALDCQPDKASRQLGDLRIEVWDAGRPIEWWDLFDASVEASHPNSDDPSLMDVSVQAHVAGAGDDITDSPILPTYKLFKGDYLLADSFLAVNFHRTEQHQATGNKIKLIGCQASESLIDPLDESMPAKDVQLLALNRTGRIMARMPLTLNVARSYASKIGRDLIDIENSNGVYDPPPTLARPIWEYWYNGNPEIANEWAQLATEGRREWLNLAFENRVITEIDRSGGTYDLDGKHVTDIPGLHCAIGEALFGPGGYFGKDWRSFNDCLAGGFGVVPPFKLVWNSSGTAFQNLNEVIDNADRSVSYIDEILGLLEISGVTTVLQ